MQIKFDSNTSFFSDIDFLGIIKKFNLKEPIDEVKLLGIYSESPDDHFYKLSCNNDIYYIYEVDYISSLEYQVKHIKEILGDNIELIKTKTPLPSHDSPIASYITDYSGSQPHYHKLLIHEIKNK